MTTGVPTPLDPRDPSGLVQQLSPGDRVRLTTTKRPRTILTAVDTTPIPSGGRLVFSVPPITTIAHQHAQHAHYHCIPSDSDSSTMTVTKYPARCIGTLTTIARLPRLSTPSADHTTASATREGFANERHHYFRSRSPTERP